MTITAITGLWIETRVNHMGAGGSARGAGGGLAPARRGGCAGSRTARAVAHRPSAAAQHACRRRPGRAAISTASSGADRAARRRVRRRHAALHRSPSRPHHIGPGLVDAHGRRRHHQAAVRRSSMLPRANRPWRSPGWAPARGRPSPTRAGLGAGVDAHHARRHRLGEAVDLHAAPGADAQTEPTSSGATAASSSTRDRSTISTRRASSGTRSPGCTSRCATMPVSGARISVSWHRLARQLRGRPRGLQRGLRRRRRWTRGVQRVARDEALRRPAPGCWPARAAAMSSCACAAAACCSAWRSRHSNSVASSWPSNWPAVTRVAFAHRQRLSPRPPRGP